MFHDKLEKLVYFHLNTSFNKYLLATYKVLYLLAGMKARGRMEGERGVSVPELLYTHMVRRKQMAQCNFDYYQGIAHI